MVTYHPPSEMLAAYSAGTLQSSHALCVSTHLEYCPDCRSAVKGLNVIGAQLMEELEPRTGVGHDLRDSVLARIAVPAAESTFSGEAKPAADVVESAVQAQSSRVGDGGRVPRNLRLLKVDSFSKRNWKKETKSIFTSRLFNDGEKSRVELLKIMPGGSLSKHTHIGEELTVILEGSFSDEDGVYKKGDFLIRDGSHQHQPTATNDVECICLTVQDGPIQFTGWLMRIINPFLRYLWVRNAQPAY